MKIRNRALGLSLCVTRRHAHWSWDTWDIETSRKIRPANYIMDTLVVGMICLVGIIGNSFTFAIFWKGKFNTTTSFLFMCQSLTDSAVLLSAFVWSSIAHFDVYTGSKKGFWKLYPYIIVYVGPIPSTTGGSDGDGVGDGPGRCQPLRHRVSTVKSVSVVHDFEGEDTVGNGASVIHSIQRTNVCRGRRRVQSV